MTKREQDKLTELYLLLDDSLDYLYPHPARDSSPALQIAAEKIAKAKKLVCMIRSIELAPWSTTHNDQ